MVKRPHVTITNLIGTLKSKYSFIKPKRKYMKEKTLELYILGVQGKIFLILKKLETNIQLIYS